MNQWNAGALRPPHLAPLCIWEGSCDYYRELCRHGGILSDFLNTWHPRQVAGVQGHYGCATRARLPTRTKGSRGLKTEPAERLWVGPFRQYPLIVMQGLQGKRCCSTDPKMLSMTGGLLSTMFIRTVDAKLTAVQRGIESASIRSILRRLISLPKATQRAA
jgi:hypothetical protein